ncbi:MAG: FapA family protein, partial [Treponema sp.]|nr:FapA family protein [Treponema sp.]
KEKALPNGGTRLIAVRPGECSFDGKALKVSSLREIKGDVGPATGNIKFSGELRILGKVLPGFAVIGGLNVIVAGTAEAALVSAGGKAVISGGIRGGGKGVVRARSCIEAAFSEKATLMAVDGITLKNGAVLSFIKTNGKFTIEAENGKLLGGVCQARDGIDAANIGAEGGGRTEISFGQDYLLKDQIGAMEEEINKVKVELAKIEERIKALLKVPEGLAKARTEKVKLLKLLEQYNLKVFTLREKFEEHYNSLVTVRGSVYPGVVIESHDRYYEVHQTRSRVVFYFDRESGRIKERHLE